MGKIKKILISLSLIFNLIIVIFLLFLLHKKNFNMSYFIDRAVQMLNNKKSIGLNIYYGGPYWQQKVSQFRITNRIQNRSNAKKILLLGDSITENFRIEQFLTDGFSNIRVFNHGITGDNTFGVLNRLNEDLDTLRPDRVFIMVGINDILAGFPIQKVIDNYKEIIKVVINRKIPLFVQSTLYTRIQVDNNNLINQLNKELKTFCLGKCTYIDLNTALHSKHSLNKEYSVDGIHITGEAYNSWFNSISTYIKN